MAATIRVTLVLADDQRKPYRQGQTRRLRDVGSVSITSVETITLADIDRVRARALGHFEARGQRNAVGLFQRAWIAEHDEKWLGRAEQGYDRGDIAQAARFAQRWAWQEASLVSYTLAEQPRFLAAGKGTVDAAGNGDYTGNAAKSIDPDAECVDAATQERFSRPARALSLATRQTFQADLETERAIRKGQKRPYPKDKAA